MTTEAMTVEALDWFCEGETFWGTASQLCLCAKCGKNEIKRPDEPRHFRGVFKPWLHTICDDCFDALPDEFEDRAAISFAALRSKDTPNV